MLQNMPLMKHSMNDKVNLASDILIANCPNLLMPKCVLSSPDLKMRNANKKEPTKFPK